MISAVLLFGWRLGGGLVPSPVVPAVRLSAAAPTPVRLAARDLLMPLLHARSDATLRLLAGRTTARRLLADERRRLRLTAGPCAAPIRKASDRMSISSHLTFFRGEDITLDFQMSPPIDISGWTITFTAADGLGGTVQITKTATSSDGPRGRFRVVLASADTAALDPGRYVWDVRRTDSGNRATLADGYLDLRREVTA